MNKIVQVLRAASKAKFRALNMRTVKDIPTEQFNEIISVLLKNGWEKTYEYDGFDAWIDYGKVKLKNKNRKLKFEWDNWTEGSIEAEEKTLKEIAEMFNLTVVNEWRWSEYDKIPGK